MQFSSNNLFNSVCEKKYHICLYNSDNVNYANKMFNFMHRNDNNCLSLISGPEFKIMVSIDIFSNEICGFIIYRIAMSKKKVKYLSIENIFIDPKYEKIDLSIYLTYVIFNLEMQNIQRIYCRNIYDFYNFVLVNIFNFKKLNGQEKDIIKDIFNDTNEYHNIVIEVEDPEFTFAMDKINKRLNLCVSEQKNEQSGGTNNLHYLEKYKKYKKKYRNLQTNKSKNTKLQ